MVCRDDRDPPLAVGEQTAESIVCMDYVRTVVADSLLKTPQVGEIPRYSFLVDSEETTLDPLPFHGLHLLRDERSITPLLAACDDKDFHLRTDRGFRA